jgi:hypothetical protein
MTRSSRWPRAGSARGSMNASLRITPYIHLSGIGRNTRDSRLSEPPLSRWPNIRHRTMGSRLVGRFGQPRKQRSSSGRRLPVFGKRSRLVRGPARSARVVRPLVLLLLCNGYEPNLESNPLDLGPSWAQGQLPDTDRSGNVNSLILDQNSLFRSLGNSPKKPNGHAGFLPR